MFCWIRPASITPALDFVRHLTRSAAPRHDDKTDDHDLFGIHRAAVVGFGLVEVPLDQTYLNLRALARHRRDLVQMVSAVQQQIREHLHATMPGFAALFEADTLWASSVALPLVRRLAVPDAVCRLGSEGIAKLLRDEGLRCQQRTIDKIVGWATQAAAPAEDALIRQRILCDLDDDRITKRRLIARRSANRSASVLPRTALHSRQADRLPSGTPGGAALAARGSGGHCRATPE
jgi:hypothetical protein